MFSLDCRTRSDSVWQDIFHHPFVQGMGDGTLTSLRFTFYLNVDMSWQQRCWPQQIGAE